MICWNFMPCLLNEAAWSSGCSQQECRHLQDIAGLFFFVRTSKICQKWKSLWFHLLTDHGSLQISCLSKAFLIPKSDYHLGLYPSQRRLQNFIAKVCLASEHFSCFCSFFFLKCTPLFETQTQDRSIAKLASQRKRRWTSCSLVRLYHTAWVQKLTTFPSKFG